ncbi:MAG: membrane protein insertion efficiency factor YidD [Planctomycetes bacterium]|nr:membrane protein insertion efficiency factor YidD [Planctomycetota bacterium]
MSALRWLWKLPRRLLVALVRLYQLVLSPLVGRQCRFAPTCSEYFIGAVEKYGAIAGTCRGIARILRCHPFHRGGYDPP